MGPFSHIERLYNFDIMHFFLSAREVTKHAIYIRMDKQTDRKLKDEVKYFINILKQLIKYIFSCKGLKEQMSSYIPYIAIYITSSSIGANEAYMSLVF